MNKTCAIIAGPCSVDENNISELYQIANITAKNQKGKIKQAIFGARIVGLKSRTAFNENGVGMGIDYLSVMKNMDILMNGGTPRSRGGSSHEFEIPPSVLIAQTFVKDTGMLVASEIMVPMAQLPMYETLIPKGKFMPWNPAVNQLGWPLMEIAKYARRNDWYLGIKNGIWLGEQVKRSEAENFNSATTMEQKWEGLVKYAGSDMREKIILIHRGVDVSEKGDHRNIPVHNLAKRVKQKTGATLYFDPSHAYGPKMKEHIVPEVLKAMNLRALDGSYLYDGILIEVGTSKTDTGQHITLDELKKMVLELALFRNLASPK